jgi:hypothetical protein
VSAILPIAAVAIVGAAALALTVALLLALAAGLGAAFAWGWTPVAAARYERRLAARDAALVKLGMLPPPPSAHRRHAAPVQDPAAVDADEYWTAARAAAATAELLPVATPAERVAASYKPVAGAR